MGDGVSRCGRKTALSIFFSLSFIAFTFCLLSLLSPSWQYAYLENGRTEHHHGLWLDCKRDYSFDYGRNREYYETLYRRDLQGSPFAMFFLPPLQCVYKFDYYIDPEDLYDHNHDENRIQNDAYQHLFLGWKVAALSAVGVAVVFSACALLLGVCSFCHRTFISASTVLVTISAVLSTVGTIVFYAWANYQDNKVIKEEEDTIYEQQLGWAFHFQVVGAILHWIASVLGCCVTSISFSKTRAKLVKIEVTEGSDDTMLLSSQTSSQPFKRSFSAVYQVDSQSLRQWEKDYMQRIKDNRNNNITQSNNFQRTASMPNFSKKQRKAEKKRARQLARSNNDLFTSTSNVTDITHAGSLTTINTGGQSTESHQQSTQQPTKLKSALKTPQQTRKAQHHNVDNESDTTYEYIPCNGSIGLSTFGKGGGGIGRSPNSVVYDPVYEQIGPETYLEPNSVKAARKTTMLSSPNPDKPKALLPTLPLTGSSQSVAVTSTQKTTIIDDIARPSSSGDIVRMNDPMRIRERMTIEEMSRLERFKKGKINSDSDREEIVPKSIIKPSAPPRPTKPQMTIRDFGIDLSSQKNGYCITEPSSRSEEKRGSVTFGGVDSKVASMNNTLNSSHSSNTSSPIKYVDLMPTRQQTTFDAPSSPLRYIEVETRKGGNEKKNDNIKNTTNINLTNSSFDDLPTPPPGISINTFGYDGRASQRSITNLTFRPHISGVSEVFERPDSMTLGTDSPSIDTKSTKTATKPNTHRRLLSMYPDEVDRSVGSSTLLENDTMRNTTAVYMRDAEIRLNLFMNDPGKNGTQDETTV